ncbi:hypothetical protein CRYUN_Cryun17cG0045600 [Craigia yunnanensis]
MAMNVSSACFSVFSYKKVNRIRCVASEDFAAALQTEEEDKVKLGGSELKVTRLGSGAWSCGDTSYWNNFEWDDRKMKAAKAAFDASVDHGITFFDTAEVYGSRVKDRIIYILVYLFYFLYLEEYHWKGKKRIQVWRLLLHKVCSSALEVWSSDCPQCTQGFHLSTWAFISRPLSTPLRLSSLKNDFSEYIDGLGDAAEQGIVKAVGVSNYSERRLCDAYERLKKRGILLASNQVNYSLIYRAPEQNGVKAACDELGITLIAYSPIAQGALTGKYTPENPPTRPRARIYTPEFLIKLQPLLNRIKEIGENYGKTPTQVVLIWLIAQENVVPIPGAKNAEQAEEFAGALGWRLSNEEVDELRLLGSEISPVIGFPVENLSIFRSN